MKKLTILIITIAAIIFLVALFYYINSKFSKTLEPSVQESEALQPEKMPFDASDNLDQAIDDLNALGDF